MSPKPSLNLAVIGNGVLSALIDREGRMVWCCWPRLDADPIFCALIDGDSRERGLFAIVPEEPFACRQHYLGETAILRTVFTTASGAFAVTDFAPLFEGQGETRRPPTVVRRLEPLAGAPRVKVVLKPLRDYGAATPSLVLGSDHVRFTSAAGAFRVTTDAPVNDVVAAAAFALTRPLTFVLHADEALPDAVDRIGADYEQRTGEFWRGWVGRLAAPEEWREPVIRAAITLQLCCYAPTGGIVAAMTTSVSEAAGSQRNWDYRCCWLRDSRFTVQALDRVGVSDARRNYLAYLDDVLALADKSGLKPVYGLTPTSDLAERVVATLAGYRGQGPVRVGNAAATQVQHDVYGDAILAAAPLFVDESPANAELFARLEPLGEIALTQALVPDAGIWELRGVARVHTYSAAMCWAACDGLARIAERLGRTSRSAYWRAAADSLSATILSRAWNETQRGFCGSLDGDEFDASVLLLHEIGLVAADDPRFVSTVDQIGRRLERNGMLLRYDAPDDFGVPTVAFAVCTFWYVDALAAIGRIAEARALFETLLARRNPLGLLSEDIDPSTGELWGNFPQTYSMAGIIFSAMRLSRFSRV